MPSSNHIPTIWPQPMDAWPWERLPSRAVLELWRAEIVHPCRKESIFFPHFAKTLSPFSQEYHKTDPKAARGRKKLSNPFPNAGKLFFFRPYPFTRAILPLESLNTTNHSSQQNQVYRTQRQVLADGKCLTFDLWDKYILCLQEK